MGGCVELVADVDGHGVEGVFGLGVGVVGLLALFLEVGVCCWVVPALTLALALWGRWWSGCL